MGETEGNQVKSKSAQLTDWQEDLFNLLALGKWAISVFKTAAFNHSAIPPDTKVTDSEEHAQENSLLHLYGQGL
jgi:hypothetical protein